ncbi:MULTISPECIES: SPFH domain-containing protein [Lachnospiraceae]|uniref:SPFH domain-containing protein n=1 Tax=Faecalicatena acetigenes TaxID=2981790 RepID=A0ABT2T8C5_9FIRM|nr:MULTISPECIES: SPFH domain-containing protein [Lachnospiraceae]MCU6746172.1 SPFH domain-containing protein [Faecalicatena acetigenes]SCG99512.1 SPFH domain / Band 7 family [uncultured Clostridium sp.]
MNGEEKQVGKEKAVKAKNGYGMLLLWILGMIISIGLMIAGPLLYSYEKVNGGIMGTVLMLGIALLLISIIGLCGLKVLNPNEAYVFALFGTYYGTIKEAGFFWVNPFCTALNPTVRPAAPVVTANGSARSASVSMANKKVSLRTMTLNNEKQKVNDELGNPVEIGAVVIWKVSDPTKAVINVENYKNYLSIQCDAIIRNTARKYPYDTSAKGDEKSLRGSSQEIAEIMSRELQEKTENAGIQILEVRITHLAYAPEIASAMLQRQQAAAIIDARQKIVEGAVGMVEMALARLNEQEIVQLDEDRKAAMVSNLLVVLCGNKDAQPIVNSGTIV